MRIAKLSPVFLRSFSECFTDAKRVEVVGALLDVHRSTTLYLIRKQIVTNNSAAGSFLLEVKEGSKVWTPYEDNLYPYYEEDKRSSEYLWISQEFLEFLTDANKFSKHVLERLED